MDPCATDCARSRRGRRDRDASRPARSPGRCERWGAASASVAQPSHQLRDVRRTHATANAHRDAPDRDLEQILVSRRPERTYANRKQPGRATRDLASLRAAAQAVKPAAERAHVEPLLRAERRVRKPTALELPDDLGPLLS